MIKRQRRQAAAAVVGSLWSNNNDTMGRKSTAQPRPEVHVPPRGIGPIVDPNENDVLCGRGGRINSHPGNIRFRNIISVNKKEYLASTTKKLKKAHIAAKIVYDIRGLDPAGRFLKEDTDTGLWFDIGDAKAIKKTGQALREDAPDIRNELEGDSSGDEKMDEKASPPAAPQTTMSAPSTTMNAVSSGSTERLLERPAVREAVHPSEFVGNSITHQKQPLTQQQNYQVNPYLNNHQGQAQAQAHPQAFEERMIPIQMPHPTLIYARPNQMVTGTNSVVPAGRRTVNASRHVMDALSTNQQQQQYQHQQQHQVGADSEAFGMQFYEPSTMSGGGNTMSTISGISDPISSTIGNSALMSDFGKEANFSVTSGLSALTGMDSARHSRRSSRGGGFGLPFMGRSSRHQAMEASRSGRSFGSLTRSHSFGSRDMRMNLDDYNGAPVSLSEEFVREFAGPADDPPMYMRPPPTETQQAYSGASRGGRRPGPPPPAATRDYYSSAMSIASASSNSSERWLASLRDAVMADDTRTVTSEMSASLSALDLASFRGYM